MSPVRTYRAVDYQVKLYGFWPTDLAAIGTVFIVAHGIVNSFLLDLAILVPGLWVAWRTRNRSPRHLWSLLSFLMAPRRFNVGAVRELHLPDGRRSRTAS